MWLDVVLWVLLALAVVGLVALVVRKLPVLKAIDPDALAELQQRQVKRSLVEGRIRRRINNLGTALLPMFVRLKSPLVKVAARVREFEEQATQEIAHRKSKEFTVAELLARGREALAAHDTAAAEQAFLEALRQSPYEPKAYEGLGETYLDMPDYEQAGEVYRFLIKRSPSAGSYLGLARVAAGQGNLDEARQAYLDSVERENAVAPRLEFARVLQELGDSGSAQEQVQAARELEPSNPKILDFFIELSIVNGRPLEAQQAIDALREVNPDNQKIPDFVQAVRELTRKLKPKRASSSRRASTFGLPVRGEK